jgi:hypothetical protein
MNLMKSLDEYEELLAPARQRFAVSPGIQMAIFDRRRSAKTPIIFGSLLAANAIH